MRIPVTLFYIALKQRDYGSLPRDPPSRGSRPGLPKWQAYESKTGLNYIKNTFKKGKPPVKQNFTFLNVRTKDICATISLAPNLPHKGNRRATAADQYT